MSIFLSTMDKQFVRYKRKSLVRETDRWEREKKSNLTKMANPHPHGVWSHKESQVAAHIT